MIFVLVKIPAILKVVGEVSAGMLGRKGAFDDVCGTVGYKLFDLRIRFDADDYAACDIVCHCI